MKTIRLGTLLMACLAFGLGAAGCSDDDNGVTPPPVGNGDEPAQLRVIHLSADAPAVDVFVDQGQEAVVSELEFANGTDYLEVPAGSYRIDVAATGTTAADAVLTVDPLVLSEGLAYTAVAFDELENIQALALVDATSTSSASNISVRAVHTAVGVGDVDIWNIPEEGDPTPLYEELSFGEAGEYLDLPAGAYTLGIDVDGDAEPDLVFSLPELAGGTIANVFAVNDGDDVFLLAQFADGTVARIDADAEE